MAEFPMYIREQYFCKGFPYENFQYRYSYSVHFTLTIALTIALFIMLLMYVVLNG